MIGSLKARAAAGFVGVLTLGLAGAAAPAWASGNAANAKLCQKGGWQQLVRADQSPFSSEEACVAYGATGGTPVPPTPGGGGNSGSGGT